MTVPGTRAGRRSPRTGVQFTRVGASGDRPGEGSWLLTWRFVPDHDTIDPVGDGAPRRRGGPMLPRSRWRTPGVTAARAVAVSVAAVVIAVPLAGPAGATPSDQPGGTTGVLDSRALDRLQQRAAEVQSG